MQGKLRQNPALIQTARMLSRLRDSQPLTVRAVIFVLLALYAIRELAVGEQDLVAYLLGGGTIGLVFVCVLLNLIYAQRLRRSLKIRAGFSPGFSGHAVQSLLSIEPILVPPLFRVRITRLFSKPGVSSPTHELRGRIHSTAQLADTVVFPHRGSWILAKVSCTCGDLFGLSTLTWHVPLGTEVDIMPIPLEIRQLPVVASSAKAGDHLSDSRERMGDLFDIKQYAPSDGVKRILWKTFARSRQLVVRRPEPAVVPEGEIPVYLIARRDEDHVASAVLSYTRQLQEANITVLFGTDGVEDALPKVTTSTASITDYILRTVWSPQAGSGVEFGKFLEELAQAGHLVSQVIIFTSANNDLWLNAVTKTANSFAIKLFIAIVPQPSESVNSNKNELKGIRRIQDYSYRAGAEAQLCEPSMY